MTFDEWKDVCKMINVMYGDNSKVIFETREKVVAWYSCLEDLSYELVSKAVKNIAMKSKYPPRIADIREECVAMTEQPSITEQEAWSMVRAGIRNGTYGAEEEFSRLPSDVQRAVVDASALSDWAMLPSDEVDTVIAALFKRQYRSVIESKGKDAVLGQIGTKAGAFAAIAEETAKRLEARYEEK
jgi:hypothetical protein